MVGITAILPVTCGGERASGVDDIHTHTKAQVRARYMRDGIIFLPMVVSVNRQTMFLVQFAKLLAMPVPLHHLL